MSEEYSKLARRLEALEAHYDTGWINRSDWSDIHLGSNATKNVDSDVAHNLGVPLSQLLVRVLVSPTGSDSDSMELVGMYIDSGVRQSGVTVYQVSNNAIRIQTATQGLSWLSDTAGTGFILDTEDWYYKIVVKRLW